VIKKKNVLAELVAVCAVLQTETDRQTDRQADRQMPAAWPDR
jgi:hypothetical protein